MSHLDEMAHDVESAFKSNIDSGYRAIRRFVKHEGNPMDSEGRVIAIMRGREDHFPDDGDRNRDSCRGIDRSFRRGDAWSPRQKPEETQLRIAAGTALLLFGGDDLRMQAAKFLSRDDMVVFGMRTGLRPYDSVQSPILGEIDKLVTSDSRGNQFMISPEVAEVVVAVASKIPPRRNSALDSSYDTLRQQVEAFTKRLRDGVERGYARGDEGEKILSICDAIENPQREKTVAGVGR